MLYVIRSQRIVRVINKMGKVYDLLYLCLCSSPRHRWLSHSSVSRATRAVYRARAGTRTGNTSVSLELHFGTTVVPYQYSGPSPSQKTLSLDSLPSSYSPLLEGHSQRRDFAHAYIPRGEEAIHHHDLGLKCPLHQN